MPSKKVCIDCGGVCYPKKGLDFCRCRKCLIKYNRSLNIYRDSSEYRADWNRRKKYGLLPGEFDALWVVFHGRCGICNQELKMPTKTRGQQLDVVSIDHDHDTGNIRGLLCNSCNKGIGFLKDNPDIIRRAYLWVGGCNEEISNNKKNK